MKNKKNLICLSLGTKPDCTSGIIYSNLTLPAINPHSRQVKKEHRMGRYTVQIESGLKEIYQVWCLCALHTVHYIPHEFTLGHNPAHYCTVLNRMSLCDFYVYLSRFAVNNEPASALCWIRIEIRTTVKIRRE